MLVACATGLVFRAVSCSGSAVVRVQACGTAMINETKADAVQPAPSAE